jgi:transcriptional regulator GlxA family with amidase domain
MEDGKSFWLAQAQSYLSDCRTRASSVRASEFALRMRRSPAQLAREFHASAGCCVKDYLKTLQIERAKELLRTTERSTAQIAVETGFGTVRSFYRAFRRCTGISPTEYRKEMSLAAAAGRN